jgi:hypothetical protein
MTWSVVIAFAGTYLKPNLHFQVETKAPVPEKLSRAPGNRSENDQEGTSDTLVITLLAPKLHCALVATVIFSWHDPSRLHSTGMYVTQTNMVEFVFKPQSET